MSIYLDRQQCTKFGVDYFKADSARLTAYEILESKDYDREHRDFLEPFGYKFVQLTRQEADPPGWYKAN